MYVCMYVYIYIYVWCPRHAPQTTTPRRKPLFRSLGGKAWELSPSQIEDYAAGPLFSVYRVLPVEVLGLGCRV